MSVNLDRVAFSNGWKVESHGGLTEYSRTHPLPPDSLKNKREVLNVLTNSEGAISYLYILEEWVLGELVGSTHDHSITTNSAARRILES